MFKMHKTKHTNMKINEATRGNRQLLKTMRNENKYSLRRKQFGQIYKILLQITINLDL